MIKKLQQLLSKPSEPDSTVNKHSGQLAAAALLVEVMTADGQVDEAEQQAISTVLNKQFGLSPAELDELFIEARKASHDATCLYQFTRLINDHYSAPDKYQLVVNLWQIAYADHQLDKYEEGLIRQICELIYVSHSDFIRAKHQVRD